ncbi:glycosyltransferase family 1 protein [Corallococcus sicarius]|uniref:Glycosyltransferase family 1 protein n=2 Tax=Corallococcus sicarius TaxID=2316726 RepID=A0A3A8MDV3_9BACT|nr:glycosyltransferase family 1 protein [Corallococcus sicarius]
MKGLRIALLMSLAPRKQGSLEDWIHTFCREAARRGHEVDVWLHEPMLPSFVTELKASGARVDDLAEFERSGLLAMTRRLASHDVIHLNFLAPRSIIAMAAYAAWPTQVLYTAHSDLIHEEGNVVRRSLRWAANQATMVRVHSLAGVSEHVRVKEGRRFGLYPHRSHTILNGVDTRRFHPGARPRPGGPVELITIANLVEHKGVHHLLGALGRLRSPRGHLRVVGDGPAQQSLRMLAVQLGIQHQTEFLGLRSDVQDLLGASDIYIQPTLAEAFGLTVAEAMACGCAVVASRVGGISELIQHGRTGLLVEPGDEAGFAAALECLIDDPVARRQLGEAARQRACEAFELSKTVRRHVDWCEEAVGYGSQARIRLTTASFLPEVCPHPA